MNLAELIAACREQQRLQQRENAVIMLHLAGNYNRCNTRALWPNGPVGQVIGVPAVGQITVRFNAAKIIKAAEKEIAKIVKRGNKIVLPPEEAGKQ